MRTRLAVLLAAFLAFAAPAAAQKRIALSFDDVPRIPGALMTPQQRSERLIASLRRAQVRQVAFFVNPGNLQQPWGAGREGQILAYVRAGHVIANHSFSHPHLSEIGAAAFIANIDQAATWLNGRPGYRPWFRFPFLDEASRDIPTRDAVRAALRERHLANGYVTCDSMDWLLDALISQAHAAGQPIDMNALRDLYVRIVVESAEFSDQMARDALHREPIQVILMHETDIEALFVADAVAALRAHGWRIVPIDQAYRDPIAAAEPDSPFLSSRIGALATLPGMPPRDVTPVVNRMDVVTQAFNTEVLHQPAPAAAAAPSPAPAH
jgi:peptidoglycan/xylan/chitin deacetylase (PgdA/CDA1 family)